MSEIKKQTNYAFIDSQNLNLGVRSLGWKLDFGKFRVYLKDKYNVSKAFLFIGYVPGNEFLYKQLQECGYICIFRPTLELPNGLIKGNVDAELVLYSMLENSNYDSAVIVTGDGDLFCLIKHLLNQNKLGYIMIPNRNSFSALLKFEFFRSHLRFVDDLKKKFLIKKKRPHKDETL